MMLSMFVLNIECVIAVLVYDLFVFVIDLDKFVFLQNMNVIYECYDENDLQVAEPKKKKLN